MENANIILEVNDLSVAFGGRTVVDKVSYRLERGKTLGIVGESGSGKSVSTLALMGLLPKNATVTGSALLGADPSTCSGQGERTLRHAQGKVSGGVELLSLDEKGFRDIRGKRISMIFQEPMTSLNPVQKCGQQVMEMMRTMVVGRADGIPRQAHHKQTGTDDRERVIQLFGEVMLPRPEKIFDSYPHEISGGQKQRVMIAMALINNPDILIADEPTTALDVTVQKTILELLRSLQKKFGISIIFITHDLGVIAQIADDIMVMYRGKMVEQGAATDILHNPQHPYTRGLLACRPPLVGRPKRLPTVEDFLNGDVRCDPSASSGQGEPGTLNFELGTLNLEPGTLNPERVPLLSVRNINVEYTLKKSFLGRPLQKLKAVDGISFDVYKGETLGLVGESGCGKTTLGRALLRLIDSKSDSITLGGQRLDTLSAREMRRLRTKMQIIFQDPYSSLNPRITAGEAILEPLRVHNRLSARNSELKERVIDLMQRVGLDPDWYDRYPHEFSGGQRQRICIARALILNPELVICDESVSALDVSVQAQVLNLLNELKEHFGFTYIFISHDLSVVHFLSDRIMVMQSGKMVEYGDTDVVYNTPSSDYTRTLLDAIPQI